MASDLKNDRYLNSKEFPVRFKWRIKSLSKEKEAIVSKEDDPQLRYMQDFIDTQIKNVQFNLKR